MAAATVDSDVAVAVAVASAAFPGADTVDDADTAAVNSVPAVVDVAASLQLILL